MMYEKDQISEILGIGTPLLMLDQVAEIDPGVRGLGSKNYKPEDWVFKYHLKDEPIVPGVFLVEGGLQLFALTLYLMDGHIGHYSFVNKCSSVFQKKVLPGMSVSYVVEVTTKKRGIFEGVSRCSALNGLVCVSHFSFISPHLLPKVKSK